MAVRRVAAAPLAVRAAAVVGAAVVVLATPGPPAVAVAVLVLGTAAAVASPGRVGTWLAAPAAAWVFAAGSDAGIHGGRVLLAVVGVYLLHTATAAAAAVPTTAAVERAVVGRWLRRCVPPLVLATALVGVDAGLGRAAGGPWLVVVALLVVLAAVALAGRLLARAGGGGAPPR